MFAFNQQPQQQPQQQQQQQQVQYAQQQPSSQPPFSSPMTVHHLGGSQGEQQQQQQQQQYQNNHQPFGQSQPTQQPPFGGGSSSVYGQQQPQSHQYQSSTLGPSISQQLHQPTHQGYAHGLSQPSQQPVWNPSSAYQHQQPPYGQAHTSPFFASNVQPGQHPTIPGQHDSFYQQQQQQHHPPPPPQQQQQPQTTTYLPGYLSRIKGPGQHSTRPYSASAATSRANDDTSPPKESSDSSLSNAATTPNQQHSARASRDGGSRSSDIPGQPTSPLQSFSSSFFSSSTGDAIGSARGAGTSGLLSESIFGAGGLRGATASRGTSGAGRGGDAKEAPFATPARDPRSSKLRSRTSSIGSPPGGFNAGRGIDDDDDAPPFEALADADSSRADFAGSSFVMADSSMSGSAAPVTGGASPSHRNRSTLHPSQSTSHFLARPSSAASAAAAGTSSSSESTVCTLLLYGFQPSLTSSVLSHFGGIGDLVSSSSLAQAPDDGSPASSECLRVVYSAPQFALRALRRSGELVGGVAYVGVRFADEGLHREVILNGINSRMILSAAGSGISSAILSPATAPALSTAPSNTTNVSGTSAAVSRTTRESTPSFGRPINMVDSPAAALRARTNVTSATSSSSISSSSPFGKVGSLFGAGGSATASSNGTPVKAGATAGQPEGQGGPGTPGSGGVMGRLGDAIFGW